MVHGWLSASLVLAAAMTLSTGHRKANTTAKSGTQGGTSVEETKQSKLILMRI